MLDYQLSSLPPLSLYVHIPWCVRKCPYCDFNSHQIKETFDEEAYVRRLLDDLSETLPLIWGRSVSSIFIGGGTPSVFSGEAIEQLLSAIRALINCTPDLEITMEANPGTAEASRFRAYRQAGVNRLSLGIQSFDDRYLKALGRIHGAKEALQAVELARDAGFDNINLDLMYALPGQSELDMLRDLKTAVQLAPEHLSWYQLTMEPNTAFYHQPPELPDDDSIASMSERGLQFLADKGYQRYEVSAFAKSPAHQCLHNLNYWQFGDYIGIGAGAHQKISRADTQTITRSSKRRHPKAYLDPRNSFSHDERVLVARELPLEFMMNALRLCEGVDAKLFYAHTGLPLVAIKEQLGKAVAAGLMCDDRNRLVATDMGLRYLNETLGYFLPECFTQLRPSVNQSQEIPIKSL